MSFRLLRLPDVALREVLKKFNPKETLLLAQTSLQSSRLISRHRRYHDIKITVVDGDFDSYMHIFYGEREIFRIFIDTRREDNYNSFWRFKTLVPVRYLRNTLMSRWTQKVTAFQEILDFLNKIFRIKEVSFEISREPSNWVVLILEHVKAKNLKIESVEWSEAKENEDITERFFMALKGVRYLSIQGFSRFNYYHLLQMDLLQITGASKMIAENIVALRNCKRVSLVFVWLRAVDMKRILREYMENLGELLELRMKYHIYVELEEVVKGLDVVRIEEEGNHPKYWFTTNDGIRFSVTREMTMIVVIRRET
uniref:F-box domain-containing protein n=1 Tax=Caenorhabditis tropicalis TaxID=1561998 RepID=A0A1I7UT73_9PELO